MADDPDLNALHALHYRWWRVFGWWRSRERGLKLGPLTIDVYRITVDDVTRWEIAVTWLGSTPLVDTGLRRLRKQVHG